MQKDPAIQRFGIWTGILLLLGVLLPVIMPMRGGLMWPNFEFLGIPGIPFMLKLYMIFPIIGGILCLIAVAQQKWLIRGILYLIAGFLPYLITLTLQGEALLMGRQLSTGGFGMGVTGVLNGVIGFMLPLGLLGLIAGAFAGKANPQNKIAPWMALVGGAMLGLSMLLPVNLMAHGDGFANVLISPILAIGQEEYYLALLLLILVVCLVFAVVSGIIWGLKASSGVNKAGAIKLSLRIGFIQLLVLGTLGVLVSAAGDGRMGDIIFLLIPAVIKGVGMIVGPFFAKCVGLAELVAWQGATTPPAGGDSTVLKVDPPVDSNPSSAEANPWS